MANAGDDHSTNPNPPIHLPTPIKKIKKSKYQVMKLMALPECNQELEALIRRVFREEFREELNQALRLHLPLQRSLLYEAGPSSAARRYKLYFDCKFPNRIFAEKKIEAKGPEGGHLLKVILQDAATGHLISEGPLSSMRLEIVVLPGNFKAIWTEKEFNDNILTAREGRKPLLIGESHITLQNGVAFLQNLAISDNSSWQSSKKFRLGVRVSPDQGLLFADVGGVQEAVSKAFIVRDKRCQPYQKHDIPSLEDEVWRLYKIGKDGIHSQKLASNGIYTVKDFLQRYYTDPSSLRSILGSSNNTWDTIVQHAQSCVLNNDHYSSFSAEDGFGLVFNCVLNIVGVTYENDSLCYWPLETLTTTQKSQVERLRRYAYENQSQLVPTDLPAASSTIPFAPVHIQDQLQMGMNFGYPESTLPCHSLVEQSCHNKVPMNDQLIQEPILMPNGPSLSPNVIVTGEDNMFHKPMIDVSWLMSNFNY